MVKLVYLQNNSTQNIEKNNSLLDKETYSSRKVIPHLKLVVSNSDPLPVESGDIRNGHIYSPLTIKVHPKGPYLYEMKVEDPFHYLKCDLILEVEEAPDEFGLGTVICHFPNISHAQLNDFIEEDETLLGMILIQFQMKVLEQLLIFCANHYALKLVIFVDDTQADELEIYQNFLSHENKAITPQGEKTEMIIPADRETFDEWINFMEDTTIKFRQTLWCEQKSNTAISQYLKCRPLADF